MESLHQITRELKEYFQPDEINDQVTKRDYFNLVNILGVYPSSSKKYLPLTVSQIVIYLIVLIFHAIVLGQTVFVLSKLNFTMAAFEFQELLLVLFCLVILLVMNLNRTNFRILHSELVFEFYKYEQPNLDAIEEFMKEIRKEKLKLVVLPVIAGVAGVSVLFVAPILDTNYGSITFNASDYSIDMDLPIPMIYPIPLGNPLVRYTAIFFLAITAALVIGMIGTIALAFVNVATHLSVNIKYLSMSIGSIQSRAMSLYLQQYGEQPSRKDRYGLYSNKAYMLCYKYCMKKSFQHHQLILRWAEAFQGVASWPIGFSYAFGTLVIALNLMSIKTGTSLPGTLLCSVVMCIAEIGYMALISYYGQRITDLSEELRIKIYDTEWYCMDRDANLSLLIFQGVSQKELKLVGFGLVTANFDTFANVMNSAYSYYNVIMAF